jgi:SAM-dependent methyltransferase
MDISRDTDADWTKIGEDEPYWGVLADERFKIKNLGEKELSEFMHTGELFVANLLRIIEHRHDKDFKPKRILDIGCGVGRLLIPFAKKCQQAVGLDIAPKMLELCAKNANNAKLSNIELYASDDKLSLAKPEFDLVNCFIVLQHIQPSRGYCMIKAMLDRASIGGIVSLQVTYAKSKKFFIHEQISSSYYRRVNGILIDTLITDHQNEIGSIQMYDYDLNEVFAIIQQYSSLHITVMPTNDDDHLGCHFIIKKERSL